MSPPNSMEEKKCSDNLQATRGLDISIHPYPLKPGLSPSHLLYKEDFTQLSSHLCMTYDPLGCISPHGVMNQTLRIFRSWKTLIIQHLVKMNPLHNLPPGVVRKQGIQGGPQSHLVRKARWWIIVLYEGSHVLSMLLFNTNLHVT